MLKRAEVLQDEEIVDDQAALGGTIVIAERRDKPTFASCSSILPRRIPLGAKPYPSPRPPSQPVVEPSVRR